MEIRLRSSPNHGPRRGAARPDMVVLHYTAMETAEAALARLCDPAAEVSAHYLVGVAGEIWQLVAESERAWHAGAGAWGGISDVNSHSIGIELANAGPLNGLPPFAEAQMATLEALLDSILARWTIRPQRVIGHSDMAPGRKADPGPKFDWRRLALGGRAIWPAESRGALPPADGAAFRTALATIGYPTATEEAALLAAFRARVRPGGQGALAAADVARALAVAAAHPCRNPAGTEAIKRGS